MDILKVRAERCATAYYGFETNAFLEEHLRSDILNLDAATYIGRLQDLGFRHFIILKRQNYLRFLISLYVGKKSKVWHVTAGEKFRSPTVRIDPEAVLFGYRTDLELLEAMDRLDDYYRVLENELDKRGIPYATLIYERDVEADPRLGLELIRKHIGLRPYRPKVVIRRQNPSPTRDLLENHEEIAKRLRGTRREWMLYA